uniref:SH3b domain-containing protein n=1 Tax=uncultured Chloroflexota bacterium TaxID=166587 RepID=H5SPG1_9CHLR|nr:hypothetical protein HGMM_F48D12C28 [uncultured Chloroflexota bacterium]BAL58047.1 hypothetical protein HGMM_F54B02C12 [uncultured Chloroflexota bacterium]
MLLLSLLSGIFPISQPAQAQQPTGSIPTVTGTPPGPMVTLYENLEIVNVYSGPDMYIYPPVGVMLRGQSLPALGRSADTDWIMIAYPGVPGGVAWIYGPWVSLSPGELPIVTPPPTPTPRATAAINPTLVASYLGSSTPTHLPTFTPAPPVEVPQFSQTDISPSFPVGLLIVLFALIGTFGMIFLLVRRR